MKQVSRMVFALDVRVPDDFTDEQVAAVVSRLQHYDLRGALWSAASDALGRDPGMGINVSRSERKVPFPERG